MECSTHCPSPSSGVWSNSCPLNQWCHPTISSSIALFSSCPQSFPASTSFPVSQFFTSGGRSIGASASASVLPMNIQDCFPLGWTGWISFQSKGLPRIFFNTTVQKHQFLGSQLSLHPTLTSIHDCWKTIALTRWTFVAKVMSLLFNMLSRFVTVFLQRSKRLLISWLQSPSAVILESKISSHLKQKSLSIYVDLIVYLSERLYNLLHIGSLLLLLLGRFTRVRLCATP